MDLSISSALINAYITSTIAASRQDISKLNEGWWCARSVDCNVVLSFSFFLSLSLFFSLSIDDLLFFFDTKIDRQIDRCRTCLVTSSFCRFLSFSLFFSVSSLYYYYYYWPIRVLSTRTHTPKRTWKEERNKTMLTSLRLMVSSKVFSYMF